MFVKCPQEEIFKSIVQALQITGVGCIESKFRGNVPVILDINARVCATHRRHDSLLAEHLCALQFNGTGMTSKHGCVEQKAIE